MAKSYHKTIRGASYDRALLEAAEERIFDQKDFRISEKDVYEIFELSKDGGGITETELRTLKYIRQNYHFTPNAAAWFAGKLPDIEQAVYPDQFNKVDPTQQLESLDQASSPLPEQDPSPATTPRPAEDTPAEKPSRLILHVIWGILLFVVISLAGFLLGLLIPSRDMLLRSVTPKGSMGKVMGFASTGANLGGAIMPMVLGYVMAHYDTRLVFWIPAFFVAHTFYWGDWHRDSVFGPERGAAISPTASALANGVRFTIHNDAPVVPPHIMRLVSIAVNRKSRSGRVLGPDQRLTVQEALHAVTLGAAYQYFEEDTKGSITVGKQADLVILGENPLTSDPAELEHIPVVETFSRGRSVFNR